MGIIIFFGLISIIFGILLIINTIFFIYEFKEKISYFKNNNIRNILFIISILNIAGIPPLIGFLIKFLIIKNFFYYFHITFNIIFIIIIISSIFPYIRPLLYNYS